MIAKASTAQNDETGDGTTSTVLLIGELLKQAELYIAEVNYILDFFNYLSLIVSNCRAYTHE